MKERQVSSTFYISYTPHQRSLERQTYMLNALSGGRLSHVAKDVLSREITV